MNLIVNFSPKVNNCYAVYSQVIVIWTNAHKQFNSIIEYSGRPTYASTSVFTFHTIFWLPFTLPGNFIPISCFTVNSVQPLNLADFSFESIPFAQRKQIQNKILGANKKIN